jgi:hypothetical protein
MKTKTQIEIIGLCKDGIAFCEAHGLSQVFAAYANECATEWIMEVGFNENSGYVYIALENGVSICSMLGREVDYIVTDFEDGEEHLFDSYEEAQDFLTNKNPNA